jgi:hypothetical protein
MVLIFVLQNGKRPMPEDSPAAETFQMKRALMLLYCCFTAALQLQEKLTNARP